MAYNTGDSVQWEWGDGYGKGKITEVYTSDVAKTIKGTDVTRNASADSPAYLIEQDDDDKVLKSHSELEKA